MLTNVSEAVTNYTVLDNIDHHVGFVELTPTTGRKCVRLPAKPCPVVSLQRLFAFLSASSLPLSRHTPIPPAPANTNQQTKPNQTKPNQTNTNKQSNHCMFPDTQTSAARTLCRCSAHSDCWRRAVWPRCLAVALNGNANPSAGELWKCGDVGECKVGWEVAGRGTGLLCPQRCVCWATLQIAGGMLLSLRSHSQHNNTVLQSCVCRLPCRSRNE